MVTNLANEGQKYIKINVVSVMVMSLLVTLGFSAVNLIVPYYILALKGVLNQLPEKLEAVHAERDVVEIGAMSSSFMATRAVFAATSGWLSDKFGRKRMIIAGMSLYTLLGVLYAMTTSPWQLIALRAVQGVASALVWPVAEALLVDSVLPELRTRALSIYVMTMSVGQVVGPVIGSLAYEVSKRILEGDPIVMIFRAPFIIITIATLPGVFLALMIKETTGGPQVLLKSKEVFERFKGGLKELPGSVKRALISFYASGLFNGLAAGILSSVMIIYIIDFVAKDPTKVGMILSVSGIAGLAVAYPAAHMADKLGGETKKIMLISTYVFSRTLLAIVGFVRRLWIFILIASLLSIAMNISIPLLRAIQASLIPSHLRGRVFGLQQAFFNTGMVIGPMLGAYIYKSYFSKVIAFGVTGVQAAFIISSILGLLGALLIAIYYSPKAVEEEWRLRVGGI
jgi:MFS family permease